MMTDDWRRLRGLPYESTAVLLTLPDERQRAPHDCGEAVLRTLLAWEGIVAPARFACPIDGTDPRTLESALRRIGLRVTSGEMSIDDLKHHAACERVVLCLITSESESHWVCSRGVSRGRVYYQCPWDGPGVMSSADWLAGWHSPDGRTGATYRRWGIAAWAET